MKYIVWFSWWIDSTFTAWKLKQWWNEVILIHLLISNVHKKNQNKVLKVAKQLNLPIQIIDVAKDFKDIIIQDFIQSYKNARTPNPCVKCNEQIKFKVLEQIRIREKADKIATWHYAKIVSIDGKIFISTSKDIKKDQTYMIYRLADKKFLKKIEFINHNIDKTEIKKILEHNKIKPAASKESQDICFIQWWKYQNLLWKWYPKWSIYTQYWKRLWEHNWIVNYTIWQRHWLWLNMKLYVIEIDLENNAIIVWEESDLYKEKISIINGFIIEEIINKKDFKQGLITWKIRYQSDFVKLNSIEKKNDKFIIKFATKVRAPTPGQHCVLYKQTDKEKIIIWWWEIVN